jgi:2-polyprenyl-3-methyl-5-hydroxy-6-metoxy-1,4-benzoquinol methylase
MNVKEHYDHHLGNFYSWMAGDFDTRQSEQQQFFQRNRIVPLKTKIAIDLGCAHGIQAVSLAKLGFKVEAVDFNLQLTKELSENKGELKIQINQVELLAFMKAFQGKVDVVTCMGDTITHLDKASLYNLIETLPEKLITGGKLIVSFRDLRHVLRNEQRFFIVRSDEHRIHTCFIEYFPDHVKVYDILNTLEKGCWKQTVSWYPKLRIDEKEVRSLLSRNLFRVIHAEKIGGMISLIAEKK